MLSLRNILRHCEQSEAIQSFVSLAPRFKNWIATSPNKNIWLLAMTNHKALSIIFGVVFSALSLSLSACGFEPVYGTHASSATQGNMLVDAIDGREGQIMKIALEDTLNPQSDSVHNAPYLLRVTIKKELAPAVIADDASIRRYSIAITAQFAVIDRATSKPIYQGNAKRYGSYSRSSEDFSTFVAEEDTTKRTIEELARDIAQRVSALKLAPAGANL